MNPDSITFEFCSPAGQELLGTTLMRTIKTLSLMTRS